MQPLKMTIPGTFWDSQIYSGRLHLFGTRGDILTLDWDRLIEEWNIEKHLRLVMQCAFCRSDYLYGDRWTLLFADSDVKSLIQSKFAGLAKIDLEVSPARLKKVTVGHQDNPFPFPHADSTIYKKKIYVASSQGVFDANCTRKTRYPISTRVNKHWDAPVLALSASYNNLALAAGDDGLYSLPINGYGYGVDDRNGPSHIVKQNCIDCRWAFYSIYGSSHVTSGHLASFIKVKDGDDGRFPERKFDRLVDDQQIFHSRGYSWGTQDKLCQARNGQVHIVKYTPWNDAFEDRFKDLGVIELAAWKGDVVSGGTALFGMVIESDNALVVVPSQGRPITLSGEPVNWRTFPRSKHYENQLHVIYGDRIEILSFNHDYFVDQETKRSGIRFREFSRARGRHF